MSPVNAIVAAARQITESDLSQRLPVKRKRDELGRLATAFNDLLARLVIAFDQKNAVLGAAAPIRRGRQPRTTDSPDLHPRLFPDAEAMGARRPRDRSRKRRRDRSRRSRMTELVENLLDLAQGDEGRSFDRAEYDLRAVTSTAVDAARTAQKKVEVASSPPPSEPVPAVVNRAKIQQVLTILLDNAVKYTPQGGKVSVTLARSSRQVDLKVSDTGIGISSAALPHLFERFYRADTGRATGGTGLGLRSRNRSWTSTAVRSLSSVPPATVRPLP